MTKEEFNKILEDNNVVMAKFSAEWCGPCKALAPIIEEVAEKHKDNVYLVEIDVEESPDLATQYRIRNVPTVLYFKQTELKDKTVGLVSANVIEEKINSLNN